MKDFKVMYTGGGWWNVYFTENERYVLWWCSSFPEEFGCKVYDIDPISDENWEMMCDYDEDLAHTIKEMSDDEALDVLRKIYPAIAEIDKAVADEIARDRITY